MEVREAIEVRRAYRSLNPVPITDELIRDLAASASLSPSCFNYQPWRFVFIRDPTVLEELWPALSKTNKWIQRASMIVAVFSRKEDDCRVRGRDYHQFDAGMAVGFLMLRATELGLVAHPIAGYREKRVRETLGIPEEYQIITLVIVGKRSDVLHEILSESQKESEKVRPPRLAFEEFAYIDRYG
ncbi:MAG: nitroreductase family protein [Candidatus Bathyarchaeota archaeon]|nr:MAG: nitroreductase family protein [Candidatus Bathyarchaeota archaeon]